MQLLEVITVKGGSPLSALRCDVDSTTFGRGAEGHRAVEFSCRQSEGVGLVVALLHLPYFTQALSGGTRGTTPRDETLSSPRWHRL